MEPVVAARAGRDTRVWKVVAALLAGLALGLTAAGLREPALDRAIGWLEPVGAIWINAIRMTVVPLVVALLILAVARVADARRVGRTGVAAFAVFLGLLVVGAAYALLVTGPAMGVVTLDAAAAASLQREASVAGSPSQRLPGFGEWIAGLAPTNPVRAAADGAMLPLVVFALIFALALRRIPPDRAWPVTSLLEGVGDAMIGIVRWVIALAPIGVFALVTPLAARLGPSMAGALGYYVVTYAALLTGFTVVLSVLAFAGGMSPWRFARAALPSQAVAFSSSSSLASLPALFDSAARLGLPRASSDFVLPLAVASFKVATPITWTAGAVFIGRLYGIELGTAALLTVAATAVVTSFATPGVPNAGFLLLAPVLANVGLPAGAVALLIAVDAVPDLFATVTNVTGDLAASAVVARTDLANLANLGSESN